MATEYFDRTLKSSAPAKLHAPWTAARMALGHCRIGMRGLTRMECYAVIQGLLDDLAAMVRAEAEQPTKRARR